MNLSQATELYTLITACRHVEETNAIRGYAFADDNIPGCLLCNGIREGVYTKQEVKRLKLDSVGFHLHFGCTKGEASRIIFHKGFEATGEGYYQAGKELIKKYGHWDAVNKSDEIKTIWTQGRNVIPQEPSTMNFEQCMDELRVTIEAD